MQQVISLTFRSDFAGSIALLSRPDIQIDVMLLALVDKRGHSSVIQVFEPTPDKRKSLGGKVLNRGSEIQFAIEPWFYCVLIGRDHIRAMTLQLQRANVIGYDLLCQKLIRRRTKTWERAPDHESHQEYKRRYNTNWKPAPAKRAAAEFRLCLASQGRANALFQPRWSGMIERALFESRAQCCLIAIGTGADLAFLHVLLDLQTSGQIQLAIYVCVNKLLCCLTTQLKTSVCV